MKTLKTLTVIALLLLSTNAFAIDQEAGAHLLVGMPTGDFGDAVDNVGIGIEAHYGLRPTPCLTIGIGANYMMYGSETRDYELPLVEDFKLKTTNNLAGAFLFAQARPFHGTLQPYAEVCGGFNYLWTESKLEDEDWWDDDEVARETNYDDCALYWGAGGGLMIRIMEGVPEENTPGWFVDMKVMYHGGAKAEYLAEGDITIVEDAPVYAVSESNTNLTTFKLGVVMTF